MYTKIAFTVRSEYTDKFVCYAHTIQQAEADKRKKRSLKTMLDRISFMQFGIFVLLVILLFYDSSRVCMSGTLARITSAVT